MVGEGARRGHAAPWSPRAEFSTITANRPLQEGGTTPGRTVLAFRRHGEELLRQGRGDGARLGDALHGTCSRPERPGRSRDGNDEQRRQPVTQRRRAEAAGRRAPCSEPEEVDASEGRRGSGDVRRIDLAACSRARHCVPPSPTKKRAQRRDDDGPDGRSRGAHQQDGDRDDGDQRDRPPQLRPAVGGGGGWRTRSSSAWTNRRRSRPPARAPSQRRHHLVRRRRTSPAPRSSCVGRIRPSSWDPVWRVSGMSPGHHLRSPPTPAAVPWPEYGCRPDGGGSGKSASVKSPSASTAKPSGHLSGPPDRRSRSCPWRRAWSGRECSSTGFVVEPAG